MKDVAITIDFILEVSFLIYGKQVFSYDYEDSEWYSRHHCKVVTYSEVLEWLQANLYPLILEDKEKKRA